MTEDVRGVTARGVASAGIRWREIAVLAVAVLSAVAMYVAGVLLPYYVNDLHRLPLAEVTSGAHDPKDLWPGTAWGGLPQLAGYFSLALLPISALVALGVGGVSLVGLWRRREPQRVPKSLVLLVVMATSVVALSFMFSPTGEALVVWRLD